MRNWNKNKGFRGQQVSSFHVSFFSFLCFPDCTCWVKKNVLASQIHLQAFIETQTHRSGVFAGPNCNTQSEMSKASGRRKHSVRAEKDCLAVSLTAPGVFYFPYDLLSLCQWHFKYALAHLCQRPRLPVAQQKQGCCGKYKGTEQAQGGETEINRIGQNERQVSKLHVRKAGGEVASNRIYGVVGGV